MIVAGVAVVSGEVAGGAGVIVSVVVGDLVVTSVVPQTFSGTVPSVS